MRALILNGSRKADKVFDDIVNVLVHSLKKSDYEVDCIILHKSEISDCDGCFSCWIKTPGICVVDDDGRDIAIKHIQSDLLILLTPITFGGYSSELKKAIDRLIPNELPFYIKIHEEIHHEPRYEQYPSLIGVGVLSHPDEESEKIFKKLVSRNAINLHSPKYSEGVVYLDDSIKDLEEKVGVILGKVGVGR